MPNKNVYTLDRQLSPVNDNLDDLVASTRKILSLAEEEKAVLVVFGHDGVQWQT